MAGQGRRWDTDHDDEDNDDNDNNKNNKDNGDNNDNDNDGWSIKKTIFLDFWFHPNLTVWNTPILWYGCKTLVTEPFE